MKHTAIAALYKEPDVYAGQTISIGGWVRTVRASKAFAFMEINDGSAFKSLQIVLNDQMENFAAAVKTSVGSAVIVTGVLVKTPDAPQPFELQTATFALEGASRPEYPLQKKRHSLEFLRTIAHLRPRTNTFNAVFRVRSEAAFAIHQFFHDKGFIWAHTPIITGSDCEGAGEMFRVTTLDLLNPPKTPSGAIADEADFFGKETNLTVSGQLEGETFAMAFGKIYTFGPTFRAENSNTARHAAEFWMIEPEIAFADLSDNMDLADEMMKSVVSHLLNTCPDELAFFNKFMDKDLIQRLTAFVNTPAARITYTEAVAILQNSGETFAYPVSWGSDLQTEHERYLAEKHFQGPVFVTDYPKEIKSFYMRQNDDGKTVAAMDMLVPGVGEIIGGSQREERLNLLQTRMQELDLPEEEYWWYLDLRRFGGTRHAGFGLGFERFIMYVTGMSNIRDVIPFPRTVGSAEF